MSLKMFGIEIASSKEIQELRESISDLDRALEDVGWIRVNSREGQTHEDVQLSYADMVRRCRLAYAKNPIVAQAVHITTNYVFGEGITEPKADSENKEVQDIVHEFWSNPDNRLTITSAENQIKLSNKLQYDGELAFAFRVDNDGAVYVRVLDPLSISEVVSDTYDSMRPLFYKRKVRGGTQYIPDWSNGLSHLRDSGEHRDLWAKMLADLSILDAQVPQRTFVYHVKINNDILDKRGVPEVYRALDWMNSNSAISSDMALFIRTQAQFAWKKKFSGTKAQMIAAKTRIGQNTDLTNPKRGAGSMIIENDKVKNEAIALPNSSGELFEIGIRRTLLMVCSAFGIMEHYFGDPSTGNLATAEAMELPMLKKFQGRQKVWEGIILDILNFQLDMRLFATSSKYFEYNPMTNRISPKKGSDYKDRFIDVDFPPILEKNIKTLADALTAAKTGQLIPVETAQRMFLQGVGVNNVDEEMGKEFEERVLPGLMSADPARFQEAARLLSEPVSRKKKTRESMTAQDRKKAARLAEKNKEVFRKMNAYLKTIGAEYRKAVSELKEAAAVTATGDGQFSGTIRNSDQILKRFESGMLRAANRYLEMAADLGRAYALAHVGVVEATEAAEFEDFLEEQIRWNKGHVEGLAPAISERLREKVVSQKFASKEDFLEAIVGVAASFESRVGMYAGAFWTVEERAVQRTAEAADPEVNFVGVDDDTTCEDCKNALESNPHRMASAPVPGEQQCLSNCRHALQIVGDVPLEESDIDLMREQEKLARAGFKLLTETAVPAEI